MFGWSSGATAASTTRTRRNGRSSCRHLTVTVMTMAMMRRVREMRDERESSDETAAAVSSQSARCFASFRFMLCWRCVWSCVLVLLIMYTRQCETWSCRRRGRWHRKGDGGSREARGARGWGGWWMLGSEGAAVRPSLPLLCDLAVAFLSLLLLSRPLSQRACVLIRRPSLLSLSLSGCSSRQSHGCCCWERQSEEWERAESADCDR